MPLEFPFGGRSGAGAADQLRAVPAGPSGTPTAAGGHARARPATHMGRRPIRGTIGHHIEGQREVIDIGATDPSHCVHCNSSGCARAVERCVPPVQNRRYIMEAVRRLFFDRKLQRRIKAIVARWR
jgi:hypothetical protein